MLFSSAHQWPMLSTQTEISDRAETHCERQLPPQWMLDGSNDTHNTAVTALRMTDLPSRPHTKYLSESDSRTRPDPSRPRKKSCLKDGRKCDAVELGS